MTSVKNFIQGFKDPAALKALFIVGLTALIVFQIWLWLENFWLGLDVLGKVLLLFATIFLLISFGWAEIKYIMYRKK